MSDDPDAATLDEPDTGPQGTITARAWEMHDVRTLQRRHSRILAEIESSQSRTADLLDRIVERLDRVGARLDVIESSSWQRACERAVHLLDRALEPDALHGIAAVARWVCLAAVPIAAIVYGVQLSGWGVEVGGAWERAGAAVEQAVAP